MCIRDRDHVLYGGKLAVKIGIDQFLNWLDSIERAMLKAELSLIHI